MTEQQQTTSLLIADIVCKYFNITFEQLCSSSREVKYVYPRQLTHALIYHYYLFEKPSIRNGDIGWLIGRKSRLTVKHSVKTVKNLVLNKANKLQFDELLDQIYKSTIETQSVVIVPYFAFNPSNRDWVEDSGQENGNYMCRCTKCTEYFFGNKHRVICKVCYNELIETDK